MGLLNWAFTVFGLGLFVAGMTFVNAYVARRAIATGRSQTRLALVFQSAGSLLTVHGGGKRLKTRF
jgi:hypothetical protein